MMTQKIGNYNIIFFIICNYLYSNLIYIFFRILSEIENNLKTSTNNSSSQFENKDDLTEEFTIITDEIDHGELKENQTQSVNVIASVRNVTVNEDIPSFREWTKKQLEEAEKQPGLK